MIEDLRRLEDGAELEGDVCLIGAGAAGIAIAAALAGTGIQVILLESGGLRRSLDTDGLNEGESRGLAASSLTAGRARVLGGATALWAGQCLPPDPATFAERPWVPHSGWPFGEAEIDPFRRRAEELLGVAGEVYDERVWDDFGVERPSIDRRRLSHRFSVWCPRPDLGRLYRKQLAAAANVRVLLHATATEIVTTPAGDRFDSVRARTPEGKAVRVRARAGVVCAGGIENARLLLASSIGNDHDLVGRFFQDHPNGHTAIIAGADAARLQELYGLLYRGRVRYLPRLVLSDELQSSEQVLSCAAYPVFHFGEDSGVEAARRVYRSAKQRQRPALLRRELGLMAADAPRLARVALRRLARGRSAGLRPQLVTLQTHAEQAPNRDSRVTLTRARDRLGVPLPKVEWKLTELDRRTHEAMVGAVGAEFRRLGLGDVRAEPWLGDPEWTGHVDDAFHHMGTTRLGTDPTTSVVDPDCQVHGVSGLFVAGSSVFPAAGYVNPTLTIVALAIRLADRLGATFAGRANRL